MILHNSQLAIPSELAWCLHWREHGIITYQVSDFFVLWVHCREVFNCKGNYRIVIPWICLFIFKPPARVGYIVHGTEAAFRTRPEANRKAKRVVVHAVWAKLAAVIEAVAPAAGVRLFLLCLGLGHCCRVCRQSSGERGHEGHSSKGDWSHRWDLAFSRGWFGVEKILYFCSYMEQLFTKRGACCYTFVCWLCKPWSTAGQGHMAFPSQYRSSKYMITQEDRIVPITEFGVVVKEVSEWRVMCRLLIMMLSGLVKLWRLTPCDCGINKAK